MRGRILVLAAVAVVVLLIVLLRDMLMPFVVSAGLAYVFDPIVTRLQRRGLNRTLGVVVVFAVLILIVTLLVFLLIPLLQAQVNTLVDNVPHYINWVQQVLQPWLQGFGLDKKSVDSSSIKQLIQNNWHTAGGFASTFAKKIFSSGSALLAWSVNLLLIPVIMFYLLRDWHRMTSFIASQLPRRHLETILGLARETDEVLGLFIRSQALVMLILGCIYIAGLWLAGLDLALVIGLGAGLVSFVPYLGVISGVSAASLAMLVQTGDPLQIIWVLIVFGIGQIMESMVLTPLLLGEAIGLHPVWVIFAVIAGGTLFGFVGVLLALPAAAALAVLIRYAGQRWRASRMYLE